MGLNYRKSINLGGGFRVNLSKSGIGYSWGAKGYRVTKTANGNIRKTYSIPGTGLSYVEEKNGRKSNIPNSNVIQQDNGIYNINDIKNANIENFRNEEYQQFIQSIEKILILNSISSILCFSIIGLPIGLPLKLYVQNKGKIKLDYEMDDYYSDKFNKRVSAWKNLFECEKVWNVKQTSSTNDIRRNAGASTLINRSTSLLSQKPPFYLECNYPILSFSNNNEKILILPDKLLIIKNGKIGVLSFDDISFDISSSNFIEDGSVPSDAKILGYTWKYVNKNGSPDKRFKDNKQIPKCQYGVIHMTSSTGLNIILQCSNITKTLEFGNLINNIKE